MVDLPPESDKELGKYLERIFSFDVWRRRLTPRKRPDARKFYGFWMAEDFENYDDFDLLGLTQGLSPTDSYEFLAVYKYAPDFRFVTDVFRPVESDAECRAAWTRAQEGDELTFEVKKDGSPAAQDAVEVFCKKESIGFIKPGHCNYFFEAKKENITPYLRAKRKIDFDPRQALFVEVGTSPE